MKFFISLIFIYGIAALVYFCSSKLSHSKKQNIIKWRAIGLTSLITLFLLILLAVLMYKTAIAPDTQCTTVHKTTTKSPTNLKTAMDYFLEGNYDYEVGNCEKAIIDYTNSIQLNPNSPQTYNNRAYTYMRLRNYKNALPDLNKALLLNPNYIEALMNRGDIHNYYYQIDRQAAIVDYKKVISLGGIHQTSVCGHLLLAEHNGWNLGTILNLPGVLTICN